jgi:predicted Holliday junction resolvase-like endonuclease
LVILNFLVEFSLLGCILYFSYIIYSLKQKQFNAESLKQENQSLKNQLTKTQSEFSAREQTLDNLRLTFEKEQAFLSQRQLELKDKEKKLLSEFAELETKLAEETEARKKVTSQKKSSEVRLGSIAETLAPFLDQFDFEPENCTFLGKPIDYISFADDEITFIEVKSGNSQLSARQRHIRDQVKAKLVSWKEVRIK